MTVTKDGREYIITELAREWKVERRIGAVEVAIRVPKETAPDAETLERFIAENGEIF